MSASHNRVAQCINGILIVNHHQRPYLSGNDASAVYQLVAVGHRQYLHMLHTPYYYIASAKVILFSDTAKISAIHFSDYVARCECCVRCILVVNINSIYPLVLQSET